MFVKDISAAAPTEPITLSDAKAYLRVEHAADDALLGTLITAARETAERLSSRSFCVKTLRVVFPAPKVVGAGLLGGPVRYSSDGWLRLPYGTVAAVDAVEIGTAGAWNATTDFLFDDDSGRVRLSAAMDARITYRTTGSVPASAKTAILRILSSLYEDRADYVVGDTVAAVPTDAESLLRSLRPTQF